MLLSLDYLSTIAAINRGLGLDLEPRAASRWIAFNLLAFATVAWTIVACLTAPTPARRRLGVGLGLVVLAGVGFGWPMNFAVAAVGIGLIAWNVARLRTPRPRAQPPLARAAAAPRWSISPGRVGIALSGAY